MAKASVLVGWLTTAGLALSALCLAGITATYCYEVVARYLFNAPTRWGSDFVAYLLCWSIFLAVPDLTRRNAHVAVTILVERLNKAAGRGLLRVAAGLGFVACLVAAFINGGETLRQFDAGTTTLAAIPVPKWIVSAPIAIGFTLSGWHFAAACISRARVVGSQDAPV